MRAGWGSGWPITPRGGAVRPLHQAVAQLAPGLQDLIAHTKAAVDSAALAHRV